MKLAERLPTEDMEQAALIRWCDLKGAPYSHIFAIANGGKRHITTAVRLKRTGVRRGVPDLFLPIPVGIFPHGAHGLFIELKRQKGGALSPEQKERIGQLERAGYRVAVCKGFEEAKAVIEKYLGAE